MLPVWKSGEVRFDPMRIAARCVTLAVLGAVQTAASPSFAADAANGRELALRWCAACHVVTSGQTRASEAVPAFSTIARRPNFDAGQLALFLLHPHPVMPNMGLSRLEAADLAAYIATQK